MNIQAFAFGNMQNPQNPVRVSEPVLLHTKMRKATI
jgi:hypothetical protein